MCVLERKREMEKEMYMYFYIHKSTQKGTTYTLIFPNQYLILMPTKQEKRND